MAPALRIANSPRLGRRDARAKCIDGGHERANRRIEAALRGDDDDAWTFPRISRDGLLTAALGCST
jgi:hypothetical protein